MLLILLGLGSLVISQVHGLRHFLRQNFLNQYLFAYESKIVRVPARSLPYFVLLCYNSYHFAQPRNYHRLPSIFAKFCLALLHGKLYHFWQECIGICTRLSSIHVWFFLKLICSLNFKGVFYFCFFLGVLVSFA